jgi:hypothetical protein
MCVDMNPTDFFWVGMKNDVVYYAVKCFEIQHVKVEHHHRNIVVAS